MNIDHEFTVPATADRAWELLTDLEQVATCMPGAQLTGVEDGVYQGLVKVKVGPVTAQYRGTASFAVKDDADYHAVVDAKGKEARGSGTASATIDMRLRPEGDATVVTVGTDLKISGKIAQFGAGMIQEVSAKLLGQFTACLEARLSAGDDAGAAGDDAGSAGDAGGAVGAGVGATGDGAGTADVPDTPTTGPEPAAAPAPQANAAAPPAPRVVAGPEPDAVNLVGVVGPALLKRLVPVAVALVAAVVLIRWLRG